MHVTHCSGRPSGKVQNTVYTVFASEPPITSQSITWVDLMPIVRVAWVNINLSLRLTGKLPKYKAMWNHLMADTHAVIRIFTSKICKLLFSHPQLSVTIRSPDVLNLNWHSYVSHLNLFWYNNRRRLHFFFKPSIDFSLTFALLHIKLTIFWTVFHLDKFFPRLESVASSPQGCFSEWLDSQIYLQNDFQVKLTDQLWWKSWAWKLFMGRGSTFFFFSCLVSETRQNAEICPLSGKRSAEILSHSQFDKHLA